MTKFICYIFMTLIGSGNLRSANNMKTKLNFLIVMDFESTCWEERRASTRAPEIIEFPAVLVNLQTGKIEEEFQQYVTPTEIPQLSQFCTTLTGNLKYCDKIMFLNEIYFRNSPR
jgi:inhibitor of KinA sporulation pathway (predicted exonuclease)